MDGNLCIKWIDGKTVALDMQSLADHVLEAIEVANCPDTFAAMFGRTEKASSILARCWSK